MHNKPHSIKSRKLISERTHLAMSTPEMFARMSRVRFGKNRPVGVVDVKQCQLCNKQFRRPVRGGWAQWVGRKCCSRSCTAKGIPQDGKNNPQFGKHISENHKLAIKEANTGERNWNWKGGYERKIWWNRHRRVMKKGNGGSHTLVEWQQIKLKYNFTCPSCLKKEPTIKLTLDHVVPLFKGGSDSIDNIQPLCMSCNRKKQIQVIRYPIL